MASLLVHLDAARLAELVPGHAPGDPWELSRDTLPFPQIERLDEQSWLFVLTTRDGTARCFAVLRQPIVDGGTFVGGTATVFDRDVTHLLRRLGCDEDADAVRRWAEVPRILPPGDVDLLAYGLGLVDDDDAVAPVVPDDERAETLRAAVWDDPASDDARMVYADYLQDRGDPRGELIGLQIGRARAGERVSSHRERRLLQELAGHCAQPLTPYLAPGFELQRGFVVRCNVNDAPMPDAIARHPAWRTVEDVSTTNAALLASRHLRARRVGLGGRQLVQLVDHAAPLPFEVVVGIAPVGQSQRGVWIEEGAWDRVARVGALSALRVLSVNPEMSGLGARLIPVLLQSPLGLQLAQLDAFVELRYADPESWRAAFEVAHTPLLTLRFLPRNPNRQNMQWLGPEVVVALRRGKRTELVIQVHEVVAPEDLYALMQFVTPLAQGVRHAELHDVGDPRGRIRDRHRWLIDRLETLVGSAVHVQPPGCRALAP